MWWFSNISARASKTELGLAALVISSCDNAALHFLEWCTALNVRPDVTATFSFVNTFTVYILCKPIAGMPSGCSSTDRRSTAVIYRGLPSHSRGVECRGVIMGQGNAVLCRCMKL